MKGIIKLQLFKFAVVGLICASVEFSVFNLLIDSFVKNYLVANAISIVISVSLNYFLSRAFVFEKSKLSKRNEFLYFVFFSILALILNQIILWILVEKAKIDIRIGKALAIGLVATFNYLTKKYFVFKS